MTAEEFSREFDLLYNNIMSNAAPGIDDYEKSVFLTKAQEDVVTAIYDGSFENSERFRECLNTLVSTIYYSKTDILKDVTNQVIPLGYNNFIDILFPFPEDCLFIVYEHLNYNNNLVSVIPTTHDALYRTLKNPFKRPDKNKAFRLNVQSKKDGNANAENSLEIILQNQGHGLDQFENYFIRYIRKPQPIILYNDNNLSINGQLGIIDSNNPCELHTMLHRVILEAAVKMASETYKQYN